MIEIPPEDFGHGRTRNLGAERSSGDLICFLTQDAVPVEGWLDAYREAFTLDERVGAAFGPHLPHPDTSPMIARELTEFFDGFAPNGRPVLQRRGDPTFLSNVNACYSRACWAELRFPDVAYSEDQAFGSAMLEAGWVKVFHPAAAVRHAHDYGALDFTRRYFDEYRGLRETTGHVEPLQPKQAARELVRDARWMREQRHAAGCASALAAARRRAPRRPPRGLRPRRAGRPAPGPRAAGAFARGTGGRRPRHGASGAAAGARPTRRSCGCTPRGPHRSRTPVEGMAERTPLHIAVADPAVRQGQRRAHDDLHAGRSARASGPHLQHLDARPTGEAPAPERGGAAPPRCRRVRTDTRAAVQGLRRLARSGRGGGHRLGYRLPGGAPPQLSAPAPTSSTTTSRSSSPRRPTRCGPRIRTSSGSTGSRRDAGCATCSRAATGSAAAGSGSASTTRSTARGRGSAGATP